MEEVNLYLKTCIYIDNTIGEFRSCKKPKYIKYFQTKDAMSFLLNKKEELEERKSEKLNELKVIGSEMKDLKMEFNNSIIQIEHKMNDLYEEALKLSNDCSVLMNELIKNTSELNLLTSSLKKAMNIEQYLNDIMIFNSDSELDNIYKRLKETSYPIGNDNQAAEYLSKLLKILGITGDKNHIINALNNLTQLKLKLSNRLFCSFREMLTTDTLNFTELNKCQKALCYLDLGKETVRMYINMFSLFVKDDLIKYHYNEDIIKLPFEQIYKKYDYFCSIVSKECNKIWNDIDMIFDSVQHVKKKLLRSIFNQLLYSYVSEILNSNVCSHPSNFCQMLIYMYNRTIKLLKDIWKDDFNQFNHTNFIYKLFNEYQLRYRKIERNELKNKLNTILEEPMNQLDQFEKQNYFISLLQNGGKNPFKFFDISICNNIINIFIKSCDRISKISPQEKIDKDLIYNIKLLFDDSLSSYLLKSLSCCIKYMLQFDDCRYIGSFYKMLLLINSIILLIEGKYNETFKKKIMLRPSVEYKFNYSRFMFINNLEEKVIEGLEEISKIIVSYCKKLLTNNQNKNDFLPKEENFKQKQTKASQEFCRFVQYIIKETDDNLLGENKISFYFMIGTELINLIKKHTINYKYNSNGIIILNIDMNEYVKTINLFKIEKLNKKIQLIQFIIKQISVKINNISTSVPSSPYTRKLFSLITDSKN